MTIVIVKKKRELSNRSRSNTHESAKEEAQSPPSLPLSLYYYTAFYMGYITLHQVAGAATSHYRSTEIVPLSFIFISSTSSIIANRKEMHLEKGKREIVGLDASV